MKFVRARACFGARGVFVRRVLTFVRAHNIVRVCMYVCVCVCVCVHLFMSIVCMCVNSCVHLCVCR